MTPCLAAPALVHERSCTCFRGAPDIHDDPPAFPPALIPTPRRHP